MCPVVVVVVAIKVAAFVDEAPAAVIKVAAFVDEAPAAVAKVASFVDEALGLWLVLFMAVWRYMYTPLQVTPCHVLVNQ